MEVPLPTRKLKVILPQRKLYVIKNDNNVNTEQQLINFTSEMISTINVTDLAQSLTQENLENLLTVLSDYYYNEEALVDDKVFDKVQTLYKTKYGKYSIIGSKPRGASVTHDHYYGSLKKKTEDHELMTFQSKFKGHYLDEDKIDGITLILKFEIINGKREISLSTHGDGIEGVDCSHILPFFNIPKLNFDVTIRGEGVYTLDVFEQFRHYGRQNRYKNPRNMITGTIIAKESFDPKIVKHLSFYTYRIVTEVNNTPLEDLIELQKLGFKVPGYRLIDKFTQQSLEEDYLDRRSKAEYEMDGKVIYQNVIIDYPEQKGKLPTQVFAFKTDADAEIGETIVTEITWKASKGMKLKPTVHYEMVAFEASDLRKATGHNARYIVNNGIGPGAVIKIKRALQVIPYIIEVIKSAPEGPSLPDEKICGKYIWNDNGVELLLTEENDEVRAGRICHFLNTLKIKKFGPVRVEMLVNSGIKTIYQLLTITVDQLIPIKGIGINLAKQLIIDIKSKITNVGLARIMDASNIFPGVGETRCEMILVEIPELMNYCYSDKEELALSIKQVKGFNKLAVLVANNLEQFAIWLQQHPMISVKMPDLVKGEIIEHPLAGKVIVFSGFRDDDLSGKLKMLGCSVTDSIGKNNKNIGILVLKDSSSKYKTGKYEKAQAAGWTNITTLNEFLREYGL